MILSVEAEISREVKWFYRLDLSSSMFLTRLGFIVIVETQCLISPLFLDEDVCLSI